MRAISIKQPYASLIIAGIKNIENRTWTTSYRGRLLIHASKSGTAADMEAGRRLCGELGLAFPVDFPAGGFVGEVDLTGVIWSAGLTVETDHPTFTIEQARGYNWQAFGWIFENPRAVKFRPARGKLGLFVPAG